MRTKRFTSTFMPIRLLGMALWLVFTLCCASCSDDDLKITAEVEIPEEGGLTGVLESYNCVIPLTITSDSDWEILFDKDGTKMAYAYPESGTGNATVKVCILGNYDEVRRSGVLTIHFPQDERKDRTVNMVQKARSESGENYDSGSLGDQSYGIGFGFYGANGMDPSVCVMKPRILKVEAMQAEGNVTKAAGSKFELQVHSYTGSTISELSNDFTTTADFEGGACGFNAEINASFNMKDFSNEQYEYSMTYIDVEEERITITSSPDQWVSSGMVCSDVLDILNDESVYPSTDDGFQKLVEEYGTHIIVAATLGGRLRSSTTYDVSKVTKEYDLEAYAKMSYSGIVDASASVDESYKSSYESNKSACTTTLTAWGGSREKSTAVALARGEEEANSAVKDWINDLNDNASSWQYIGPAKSNDLVPIWRLLPEGERRDKLETFIEEKRYLNKKSGYDLGTIGHLTDLDALDEEMNDPNYEGSLVREVNIGSQGNKTIALLCSEFIPELDKTRRVLVFYPVMNGVTKWNLGCFPGNAHLKPARISNYGGEIKKVTRTNEDLRAPREIYLRGASIEVKEIDGETEVVECSTSDYQLHTYKRDNSELGGLKQPGDRIGSYPVVKVLNHLWMRENFTGSRFCADNAYIPEGDVFFGPFIYYDQEDNTAFYSDVIASAYNLPPKGWKVLRTGAVDSIVEALDKYNVSLANAFMKGGLLGTNIEPYGKREVDIKQASFPVSNQDEGIAAYVAAFNSDKPESNSSSHYRIDESGATFYLNSDPPYVLFNVLFVQTIE